MQLSIGPQQGAKTSTQLWKLQKAGQSRKMDLDKFIVLIDIHAYTDIPATGKAKYEVRL